MQVIVAIFILVYGVLTQAMLPEDTCSGQRQLAKLETEIQNMFHAKEPYNKVVFAPLGFRPIETIKPLVEKHCNVISQDLYPVFALSQTIESGEVELVDDVKKRILQKYSALCDFKSIYVGPQLLIAATAILMENSNFYVHHYPHSWGIASAHKLIDEQSTLDRNTLIIFFFGQNTWAILRGGHLLWEEVFSCVDKMNANKDVSHLCVIDTQYSFDSMGWDYEKMDAATTLKTIKALHFGPR